MEALKIVLSAAIAYMLGSICFSVILSRQLIGRDVRETGSGNAGATNMLRNYGWILGVGTFVVDCAKGMLAAAVGLWLAGDMGAAAAGLFAVIGHKWPVFYQFRGGKGIATTVGVLLALVPQMILPVVIAGVVSIAVTRIVSLASIVGCLVIIALSWIFYYENLAICLMTTLICVINIWAHRENIDRLIKGTENKLDWARIKKVSQYWNKKKR
ncbi:MAG: glycerol-3-phosphate 1-O-acyltransferase PlsY [Christensenellales bacterium]|jgi:glycerol-3-phosphate acyltransferase PlsY